MNKTYKQNTVLAVHHRLHSSGIGLRLSSVLVTVLSILSCTTAYVYSIRSIWFALVVSVFFGNLYYYCNETYPQIVIILRFIVLRGISNKIKSLFSLGNFQTKHFSSKDLRLQVEDDGFNSLVYRDCVSDSKYIYLFNQKQRSNDLIIFKDEADNDITDYLAPYLGPLQDFHGSMLTPRDFKHKKITIFREGKINCFKTVEEYEPLTF
jgi:Family of unknown function (DUF5772)